MLASAVVVADAGGPTPAASISPMSGLQLLLRFLPFRAGSSSSSSSTGPIGKQHPAAELNRHTLLQELQADPLWRFSGIGGPHAPHGAMSAWKQLTPQEAESALLAYVRLTADAEAAQHGRKPCRQQRLASDVAAELQALATLAAIHAAAQGAHSGAAANSRPWRGRHGGRSLSEGDFMQLLKAYTCLDGEEGGGGSGSDGAASSSLDPSLRRRGDSGRTQAAAAAAMQALHAFARLADAQGVQDGEQDLLQQQQQQQHKEQQEQDGMQLEQQQQAGQAPGQLQASVGDSSPSSKQGTGGGSSSSRAGHIGSRGRGQGSSSSGECSQSGDLQVLLQLAQLTLQAAS